MTPKEIDFCEYLLRGFSKIESYRLAFDRHAITDKLAIIKADGLLSNPVIKDYLITRGYEDNEVSNNKRNR